MRHRPYPLLVAAATAAVLPPALLHFVGRDKVYIGGWIHFGAVAVGAAAATAAALALTIAGARRRDGRAVLVGTAFSVMAALLCLHGLTTPGIIVGSNGVVGFTGGATLPVGAAILALGSIAAVRRPESVRPLLALLALGVVGVVALGALAIAHPALVPSVPEPRSTPAIVVLAAGLAFYGLLGWRALRTFAFTRRSGDLAVGVGIVWLSAALAAALLLDYWNLGWWLGHAFEVVGIFFVGAPVAIDLYRSAQSRPLIGDLRGSDLVDSEEAFLGSEVRALMVALAVKDAYTETHTRRVARLAVRVGEELGLSPGRLRTLAIGGLLHDIGKLSVPDSILKKPAALTDEEFAVVERHPEWGVELLRKLGGFPEGVHRLVLDHHERLDGSGYPRALQGGELALDACILAVCDVYDALRSERVYRPAWSHERAIALLREGSGSVFDPRCVGALLGVLDPGPSPGERRSSTPVVAM